MSFIVQENQKTVRISLKKREMIDLMKACTLIQFDERYSKETQKTFRDLHTRIKEQLRKWEEQNNDNQ